MGVSLLLFGTDIPIPLAQLLFWPGPEPASRSIRWKCKWVMLLWTLPDPSSCISLRLKLQRLSDFHLASLAVDHCRLQVPPDHRLPCLCSCCFCSLEAPRHLKAVKSDFPGGVCLDPRDGFNFSFFCVCVIFITQMCLLPRHLL